MVALPQVGLVCASAGCRNGCGVSRGIMESKSREEDNERYTREGTKSVSAQPMSMPNSSSSLRAWFDQYCCWLEPEPLPVLCIPGLRL